MTTQQLFMAKKVIAVKSKKTQTIYFEFVIQNINGKLLASNKTETNFEFIPIYQGTDYKTAIKL